MEQKNIVNAKDGWSEYTLDDGTVIRLKCVLLDVKKAVGQFTIEGDPIYVMQQAVVSNTNVPAGLKKKS